MADPSVNFREQPVGGAVVAPRMVPSNALTRYSRIVVLIHGYNNTQADAVTAYEGFSARQRELMSDPTQPVANGRLVAIFWPGDENWGVASALCYMRSIGKARDTAQRLAAALRDASSLLGFLSVDIVAHSMGCRLTLEVLDALDRVATGSLVVRRVVLMAAAVPVDKLVPGAAYGLRSAYDARIADRCKSLFSEDDKVLRFAFPAGQTLAGAGEGVFPTALGHAAWGDPQAPANLGQERIAGADHSDYWGWRQQTLDCSRDAARRIRDFLQFAAGYSRFVEERPTPARQGIAPRGIPERGLP